MYIYALNGLMFFIKSLKSPTDNFNINHHITFASSTMRSGTHQKFNAPKQLNAIFYFNRIARLYNCLPVLDLSLSTNTIKHHITSYFWTHFTDKFNSERVCVYHFLFLAIVAGKQSPPTSTNCNY